MDLAKNELKVTSVNAKSLKELNAENCKNITIFWIGEKGHLTNEDKFHNNYYDTLLIYENGKTLHMIPDRYGKNGLMINYCGIIINEIGLYKNREWYKHNYELEIKDKDQQLIINWKIENIYESKSGQVLTKS